MQGDKDSFGREALDTLMKLMEDHREELVVVFAGYRWGLSHQFLEGGVLSAAVYLLPILTVCAAGDGC